MKRIRKEIKPGAESLAANYVPFRLAFNVNALYPYNLNGHPLQKISH